ncbi:hypothetical protein FOZ61_001526 [Perkinsus olseni]|uniref:Uncharacterized protein n=1 Tax=Perkinsus olseni TaxID=32597 RepID=A0A7J6KRT8_PEROL|nr:hypothetical protein FOZ61_001526 [Perkinsus olseni]
MRPAAAIPARRVVEDEGQRAWDQLHAQGAEDGVCDAARREAERTAREYNALVETAESLSARPPMAMQVVAPMPEKFDGTSDLRVWLRRFESDALAVGWSDSQMAACLGSYLTGEYFECWKENAAGQSFEEDKRTMLARVM